MKIFDDLNKNARVSLFVLPVWSVFWGLVFFYSPLYMKERGLDEVAIGAVNTVALMAGFVCYLIASPITNKLGRKRTTLVFDLLSWSIPMLIWAAAHTVWAFLVAGIINGFSKVTSIAWNCVITEDEKAEKVPKIYTVITLINSAIGVFAPVTAFFILRFGLVRSMSALYAVGGVCMAAMFIVRDMYLTETRAGVALMEDHHRSTLIDGIKNYLGLIWRLRGDSGFALLTVVFVTTNFIAALNIFQVLYLTERLAFSRETVSMVPFATAVANIAAFRFVAGGLGKARSESALCLFIACCFAGSIAFLALPAKNAPVMLAVMGVNGIAVFPMQAYRESVFMNSRGEREKAESYSAVQTVTMLLSVPAGYLGGLLFRADPRLPFFLVSALYAAAFAASAAFALAGGKEGVAAPRAGDA